jgi:hypothetical protein
VHSLVGWSCAGMDIDFITDNTEKINVNQM